MGNEGGAEESSFSESDLHWGETPIFTIETAFPVLSVQGLARLLQSEPFNTPCGALKGPQ